MVDHNYKLASFARDYIRNNSNYTLHSFEESLSICFNYKNIDPKLLCTELYNNNKLMVGYGKHKKMRICSSSKYKQRKYQRRYFKFL